MMCPLYVKPVASEAGERERGERRRPMRAATSGLFKSLGHFESTARGAL